MQMLFMGGIMRTLIRGLEDRCDPLPSTKSIPTLKIIWRWREGDWKGRPVKTKNKRQETLNFANNATGLSATGSGSACEEHNGYRIESRYRKAYQVNHLNVLFTIFLNVKSFKIILKEKSSFNNELKFKKKIKIK